VNGAASGTDTLAPFGGRRLALVVFVLVTALAFQGSRGLWEPDEGNYGNVGLQMARSGDWIVPRINGGVFLDKPPLSFWGMAAGIRLLGANEWGFRLAHALLFAGAALAVGGAAAAAFGSAAGGWGAAAYATLVLPFFAANVLTPDTPLVFGLALALCGYLRVEAAATRGARLSAWLLCGLGFGLALLAKGPAALPSALPILVHRLWTHRLGETLRDSGAWLGGALAVVLGGSWYWLVIRSEPGATAFLVDNQILGRLVSGHLERNPGWRGLVRIYGPTVALGYLPWGLFALRPLGRTLRELIRAPLAAARPRSAELLLLLWIAIPAAVFFAAQSRLPLYILPLAAPIAVASGAGLARRAAAREGAARRLGAGLVVSATLLVATKLALGWVPSVRDSRRVAAALGAPDLAGVAEIVAIDVKRNALPVYTDLPYREVVSSDDPYPYFTPLERFDDAARGMRAEPRLRLVLTRPRRRDVVRAMLAERGVDCRPRDLTEKQPGLLCGPSAAAASEAGRDGAADHL